MIRLLSSQEHYPLVQAWLSVVRAETVPLISERSYAGTIQGVDEELWTKVRHMAVGLLPGKMKNPNVSTEEAIKDIWIIPECPLNVREPAWPGLRKVPYRNELPVSFFTS